MRYRDPKKENDLFRMIEHQQSVLKTLKDVNKLDAVIDWELESILGYDGRDPKRGERPEGFEADTPKGRQKDCDARWTKKNNETHYGYKNHAKVDAKSKLVDAYATTPANVHDSRVFELQYGPIRLPMPLKPGNPPERPRKRPEGPRRASENRKIATLADGN